MRTATYRLKVLRAAALFVLMSLARVLHAQPLEWERVGDLPVNAAALDFDDTGALWASGVFLYRLPSGGSTWEEICDGGQCAGNAFLALSPDTLLSGKFGKINRSTDGGLTWPPVAEEDGALFEVPLDSAGTPAPHPHAGLLLSGRTNGGDIAYSTDRGATWVRADFEISSIYSRTAFAFGAFHAGHPFEHRVLAACIGGMAYSDDGGTLWHHSTYWRTFAQQAKSVVVGPDGTAYALGNEFGVSGLHVYASADGATWERRAALPGLGTLLVLLDGAAPGPPPGPMGTIIAVTDYEPAPSGPSVYASEDGGWTWVLLGRVPTEHSSSDAETAIFGPDERLYVGALRPGIASDWVYRTTTPVVVANEPTPVLPALDGFVLEPAYPNPFDATTVVPFSLAGAAVVRVVVLDVLGREVAVLAEGRFPAGRHETVFDGAMLPSGTYLIRAEVAPGSGVTRTLTQPVTLLD